MLPYVSSPSRTDSIHEPQFPLIPGHEAAGTIAAIGKSVTRFSIGQRVVTDPIETCHECFYCRRGQLLHCECITAYGGNTPGGFAEYCRYPSNKVFPIKNLTDLEAVLIEPASCAAHGIERIAPKVGSNILLFGCGPTGILLAQLLRQNGGCNVSAVLTKPSSSSSCID